MALQILIISVHFITHITYCLSGNMLYLAKVVKSCCLVGSFYLLYLTTPTNALTWELGNLGTWEQGNQGTREPGNLGTWELGNFGTWELRNVGTWELWKLGTWEIGNLGPWELWLWQWSNIVPIGPKWSQMVKSYPQ